MGEMEWLPIDLVPIMDLAPLKGGPGLPKIPSAGPRRSPLSEPPLPGPKIPPDDGATLRDKDLLMTGAGTSLDLLRESVFDD